MPDMVKSQSGKLISIENLPEKRKNNFLLFFLGNLKELFRITSPLDLIINGINF
jgi:hypothetical protein